MTTRTAVRRVSSEPEVGLCTTMSEAFRNMEVNRCKAASLPEASSIKYEDKGVTMKERNVYWISTLGVPGEQGLYVLQGDGSSRKLNGPAGLSGREVVFDVSARAAEKASNDKELNGEDRKGLLLMRVNIQASFCSLSVFWEDSHAVQARLLFVAPEAEGMSNKELAPVAGRQAAGEAPGKWAIFELVRRAEDSR